MKNDIAVFCALGNKILYSMSIQP